MALAFLCSQARKQDSYFKISDNPVSGFRGLVIDHGLRKGSQKEGLAVCNTLRHLGFFTAELLPLSWSGALGDYSHPKDLPNFESVARTLRYQKLGSVCAFHKIASLLTAHHEDDQYETVLMRLLQGHGSRGLRGMRKAQDIPECAGMFGADRSGFVDDQRRKHPFYNMKPSYEERRKLQQELRSGLSHFKDEAELNDVDIELPDVDVEDFYQPERVTSYERPPIDIEDGGVTVYRPLLEFSKDRLIATCLENKIPWWEDATNKDPTLTMRNAVRHLYKGYTLPKALQKPAIFALSKRCELRVQAQEADANRLLSRIVIRPLGPLAGTLTVKFPELSPRLSKRDSGSPLRRQARLQKRRGAAAILLRKILMLVSPESQPPVLATLENHVARLFPSLANPDEPADLASPRKPFNLSGVLLIPRSQRPPRLPTARSPESAPGPPRLNGWDLARTPYPSTLPPPRLTWRRAPGKSWTRGRNSNNNNPNIINSRHRCTWTPRTPWQLWDGRYWVRLKHRLPCPVVVQPFLAEHNTRSRRKLLAPHPGDRDRLSAALQRHAQGKARYTLPAVYVEGPLDLARAARARRRPDRPSNHLPDVTPDVTTTMTIENSDEGEVSEEKSGSSSSSSAVDESLYSKVLGPSEMMLVALPTLDVRMPGLDEWVSYEIRYRKVDRDTLNAAGTFHRGSFVSSPRTTNKRVYNSNNNNNSSGRVVRGRGRVGYRPGRRIRLGRARDSRRRLGRTTERRTSRPSSKADD